MNHLAQKLEVHFHNADGSVNQFNQNEAGLVQYILGGLKPAEIFSRERIVMAGGGSLTSFPSRQVARIDFVTKPTSHLILPLGVVDAVELTETEFQTLRQNPELSGQWNESRARDASMVAFLELDMAALPPLFLVLEIPLEPSADPLDAILQPLAKPVLCFRMCAGGISILNLSHLMRSTLFPSPRELSLHAWPAEWAGSAQSDHPEQTLEKTTAGRTPPAPGRRPFAGRCFEPVPT